MTFYISGSFSEDFIEKYVIQALRIKIINAVNTKNLTQLNTFLKKMFEIDVPTIIKQMSFSINKCNNLWQISINDNTIDEKSQVKIVSLVKLIEYGNLNVKGLHVINDSFRYIKKHLNELYKYYQMKGGK